jgi:hypothetical protein
MYTTNEKKFGKVRACDGATFVTLSTTAEKALNEFATLNEASSDLTGLDALPPAIQSLVRKTLNESAELTTDTARINVYDFHRASVLAVIEHIAIDRAKFENAEPAFLRDAYRRTLELRKAFPQAFPIPQGK